MVQPLELPTAMTFSSSPPLIGVLPFLTDKRTKLFFKDAAEVIEGTMCSARSVVLKTRSSNPSRILRVPCLLIHRECTFVHTTWSLNSPPVVCFVLLVKTGMICQNSGIHGCAYYHLCKHSYATFSGIVCMLYCKYALNFVVLISLPAVCTPHACHCLASPLTSCAFLNKKTSCLHQNER